MHSKQTINTEDVLPLLRKIAQTENTNVGGKMMDQISALGTEGIGPLILALKDNNLKVRVYAAMLLSEMKDPRVVDAMIEALGEDHAGMPMVSSSIIKALRYNGDKRAIPAIQNFIQKAEAKLAANPPSDSWSHEAARAAFTKIAVEDAKAAISELEG